MLAHERQFFGSRCSAEHDVAAEAADQLSVPDSLIQSMSMECLLIVRRLDGDLGGQLRIK
jgi:hypothetical protein